MIWLWWNIPLMFLFFALIAGVPVYLLVTRWRHEVVAKHNEFRYGKKHND